MGKSKAIQNSYIEIPEDFNHEDYAEFYPQDDAQKKHLIEVIEQKKFGHLSRTRLLIQMSLCKKMYESRMAELRQILSTLSQDLVTVRQPRVLSGRDHFTAFLKSLPDEALQEWAEKANVSYASFMKTGDKSGLLESIADEMSIVSSQGEAVGV